MSTTASMLDTYPEDLGQIDKAKLVICIESCVECAQACTACADACLSEQSVTDLTTCIHTDLNCADICETTGQVLSRHTPATTRICPALSSKHVPQRASRAEMSAQRMHRCTNTARSVPVRVSDARCRELFAALD